MNSRAGGETLRGQCILVTRPRAQSGKLVAELLARGARVEELPLTRIVAPDSWQEFDKAIAALDEFTWIIFASTNAVESSLERIKLLDAGQRLDKIKIACIGPSTAAALAEYGLNAHLMPESAVAESLVGVFPPANALNSACGNKVLWPRTNIGRTIIKESLEKLGWQVAMVHSYQTSGPEDPAASAAKLKGLLENKSLTVITLTSSEIVRQLSAVLEIAFGEKVMSFDKIPPGQIRLAAIGPETARTCRKLFGRVDIQADEFTVAGLVKSIERCLSTTSSD